MRPCNINILCSRRHGPSTACSVCMGSLLAHSAESQLQVLCNSVLIKVEIKPSPETQGHLSREARTVPPHQR